MKFERRKPRLDLARSLSPLGIWRCSAAFLSLAHSELERAKSSLLVRRQLFHNKPNGSTQVGRRGSARKPT